MGKSLAKLPQNYANFKIYCLLPRNVFHDMKYFYNDKIM